MKLSVNTGWHGVTLTDKDGNACELLNGKQVVYNGIHGVLRQYGTQKMQDHAASWENPCWVVVDKAYNVHSVNKGELEYKDDADVRKI